MPSKEKETGYRLSYRFRLYPNEEQKHYFAVNFGCCRYVYNYFLEARNTAWERTQKTLKKPVRDAEGKPVKKNGKTVIEEVTNPLYDPSAKTMSYYDTSHALKILKRETMDKGGHRWLYDADSTALVNALRNLEAAYSNFHRRINQGAENPGFPKFKSRYDKKQSFRTDRCKVGDGYVILPKIGRVRCKTHRAVKGEIVNATISMNSADQYYIAVNVKGVEIEPAAGLNDEIGITMGLRQWVTTSDGEVFDNPQPAKRLEKKLARAQRDLSRKQGYRKGEVKSNRYKKQQLRVNRIHNKIANMRSNATHELTRQIVNEHGAIITRSMRSSEMLKRDNDKLGLPREAKKKLDRAIADANFFEVNRQLAYKSEWAGRTFVEVPADAPTAQVCNQCGYKNVILAKNLKAEWTCPECGAVHSRKYNGAVNVLEAGRDILREEEKSYVMKARREKIEELSLEND